LPKHREIYLIFEPIESLQCKLQIQDHF